MSIITIDQSIDSDNSLEFCHEIGTEINLDEILIQEFDRGLASDINNCA